MLPCHVSKLPVEVLQSVFQFANLGLGYYGSVARCVRVCKIWRDAAIPLLYSDIHFRTSLQLERFAERIHHSAPHNWTEARHIKYLYLERLPHSDNAAVHLIALFLQTSNLHTLRVLGSLALQYITLASQTSATSLRVLNLGLERSAYHLVLPYLGFFSRLQTLALTMLDLDDEPLQQEISTNYWRMDELRSLKLCLFPMPTELVMKFLGMCSFPSLKIVDLDPELDSPEVAQLVAGFFSGLSLTCAIIKLNEDTYASTIFPCINAVSVHTSHPPRSAKHLSTHIKELYLTQVLWSSEDTEEFFTSLSMEQTGLQDVFMRGWGNSYTWCANHDELGTCDEDTLVMLRMLRYAALLAKKGINLRDSGGKTAASYLIYG